MLHLFFFCKIYFFRKNSLNLIIICIYCIYCIIHYIIILFIVFRFIFNVRSVVFISESSADLI